MISIQIEKFSTVVDEMKPLFAQHWGEIKQYAGVPFDPNYDIYLTADRIGMLVLYTVRADFGELVGYALFYIKPHSHSQAYRWGVMDLLWVSPAWRGRGLGRRLIKFWDVDLKERGVHTVHVETLMSAPSLARLVKASGYSKVAEGFTKRL